MTIRRAYHSRQWANAKVSSQRCVLTFLLPAVLFLSSLQASLGQTPPSPTIAGSGSTTSTGPKPGPVCTGPCCSNQAPVIPAGTSSMPSRWWTNQMAHGAQIQIRANTWSTWWYPKDRVNWAGASAVYANNNIAPDASVFLKVIRISNTQVQLLTPNQTYIRAGPPNLEVTGSSLYGCMDFTSDSTDPATVLTIVPQGTIGVSFLCYDGLYISTNDDVLLRWASSAGSWEVFDIREVMSIPSIRGVNMGAWLVYENWMDPSYYPAAAPWSDGTSLTIKSAKTGLYVTALNGGGTQVVCNSALVTSSSTFFLRRLNYTSGYWQFRMGSGVSVNYWSTVNGKSVVIKADQMTPGTAGNENFVITFSTTTANLAVIKAPNGKYLQVSSTGNLTTDLAASSINLSKSSGWGAAGFYFTAVGQITGEWQVSAALGKASTSSFANRASNMVKEEDWAYMKAQNINAVRIPVGWWIASGDPLAMAPFPTSDLAQLDWAYTMAAKYGVRIWLSMHAAPGSQNGWDHSGTRDGLPLLFSESGLSDSLLASVTWLAQRYASQPAFLGMGLLNEPIYLSDALNPLGKLQSYYTSAYDSIRKYSQCGFLSIMNRIGSNPWNDVMWLMLDDSHTNTILEQHCYNVYSNGQFNGMTPAQEILYTSTTGAQNLLDLQTKTTYAGVSRPVLVGEFSNAMATGGLATYQDQVNFGQAQLRAMASAQAGWFFWSLKLNRSGYDSWNWYKSSANGWLPQKPGGGWW